MVRPASGVAMSHVRTPTSSHSLTMASSMQQPGPAPRTGPRRPPGSTAPMHGRPSTHGPGVRSPDPPIPPGRPDARSPTIQCVSSHPPIPSPPLATMRASVCAPGKPVNPFPGRDKPLPAHGPAMPSARPTRPFTHPRPHGPAHGPRHAPRGHPRRPAPPAITTRDAPARVA